MQTLASPKTGPVLRIGVGVSISGHSKLAIVRSAASNSGSRSWSRLAASPALKNGRLPLDWTNVGGDEDGGLGAMFYYGHGHDNSGHAVSYLVSVGLRR